MYGRGDRNMDYGKLGVRVRQQRELSGLTQGQLAKQVGCSTSFIGHIERGEKQASVETVVALCNALAVSPSVLLEDSLTDDVMQSQLALDENNMELMSGLMHVLREHSRKAEYK